MTHLSDFKGFQIITEKIMTDKDWFDRLVSYFFGDGVAKDAYNKNNNLPKYFSCRYKVFVFDDYLRCTHYKTCKPISFLFNLF